MVGSGPPFLPTEGVKVNHDYGVALFMPDAALTPALRDFIERETKAR
jgi:hypothetical protein